MRWRLFLLIAASVPLSAFSQVALLRQQKFPRALPAGDYSGIAALGGGRYAVVDDKSADGFRVVRIDVDSLTGRIRSLADEGFRASGGANRDQEGVAYFPPSQTVFVSGEADNAVLEYRLDGRLTGRRLPVPSCYAAALPNRGLEALTYSAETHRFWLTSEEPLRGDSLLRLQSFDDSLQPAGQWLYRLDEPASRSGKGTQVQGVSSLCALGNGRLLVLEREVHIPPRRLGAWVCVKIYEVEPTAGQTVVTKKRLCEFRTRLTLLGRKFANYEGMCLGPRLADGRQTLLLVSDSQHRYRHVLRDWLRVVIMQP